MGIENREYFRDDRPSYTWEQGGRGGGGMSAVTWVIVITVGCYLVQLALGGRIEDLFMLWPERVRAGAVWQLITYAFLHDPHSPWHILFNMYILHMTAKDFEARRGSAEFVAFYLVSAFLAGIAVFVWDVLLGIRNPALGASGAVAALLMVYAFTYPHAEVRIFGVLPMKMMTFAVLIILFDSLPMLAQLAQADYKDSIAHSAHLGGIIVGILYQRNDWRVLGWIPRGSTRRTKRWFQRSPQLKVHQPPESEAEPIPGFEQRVDALLEKVAREGESSLTADERNLLMEASRRARERQTH